VAEYARNNGLSEAEALGELFPEAPAEAAVEAPAEVATKASTRKSAEAPAA
jgi:hypothetical protein